MVMYEKILVPLDRSPAAEVALDHAEALAHKFESMLLLLHVVPDESAASLPDGVGYLDAIRNRLERSGLGAEAAVRVGNAGEEILRYAAQQGASLIVMASHGFMAHEDVLNATVAHEVMQQAHVPILLVRPPKFRTIWP
jgi:nucleotide-binding universal stress UspA family protein